MTYEELNHQLKIRGEEMTLKRFPHCVASMRYREEVEQRLKQMKR